MRGFPLKNDQHPAANEPRKGRRGPTILLRKIVTPAAASRSLTRLARHRIKPPVLNLRRRR